MLARNFFAFFKSKLNIEHFVKKMTLIGDVISELRNPKNMVRYMSKKSRFRGPFDRQDDKPAQTLLQSERKHPYHI